ncbi:MAG: sulfite exporter TauE/SafE family protein [Oscillospiraceae bacterium]|nr:sulfite exporter TauE/SafE family protein [Oscillospiraceae bacterium]
MKKHKLLGMFLAGMGAGIVNGLFGAGGGMVLVPLLSLLTCLEDRDIFSASIAVILPVCIVSITATAILGTIAWRESLPYLIGSAAGGFAAARWGRKIPAAWLHRGLGILIIWGGIRYLC